MCSVSTGANPTTDHYRCFLFIFFIKSLGLVMASFSPYSSVIKIHKDIRSLLTAAGHYHIPEIFKMEELPAYMNWYSNRNKIELTWNNNSKNERSCIKELLALLIHSCTCSIFWIMLYFLFFSLFLIIIFFALFFLVS